MYWNQNQKGNFYTRVFRNRSETVAVILFSEKKEYYLEIEGRDILLPPHITDFGLILAAAEKWLYENGYHDNNLRIY